MSYGWKFGICITITVCIGVLDAFRQTIGKYKSRKN